VGRDPEGEVAEVWIDVHKEGAPLRGFAHALARLASLALQDGTPLATVVHALCGTDGGPSGFVEDCDGIKWAASIPDLVGQVLAVAWREPGGLR
jgi:ribonucleoside-diphosphate reductase alpha chain